jgi:hypothetical protein
MSRAHAPPLLEIERLAGANYRGGSNVIFVTRAEELSGKLFYTRLDTPCS